MEPTLLENLREPAELPCDAAYFSVWQVGTPGDGGVVGSEDVYEDGGLGGFERQGHGDGVEEDTEVNDSLANGELGGVEQDPTRLQQVGDCAHVGDGCCFRCSGGGSVVHVDGCRDTRVSHPAITFR